MQLGALLPLGDIGGDPATVREYAQTAEAIGYGFVEAPDHVLGASEASASEAGRTGAGLYHDPFVLFGYLAGVTPKLKADKPLGQWNRFIITMKGDRLTVVLNGKRVIENAQLPGVAEKGPIALQHHGDPVEFGNLYIRELK